MNIGSAPLAFFKAKQAMDSVRCRPDCSERAGQPAQLKLGGVMMQPRLPILVLATLAATLCSTAAAAQTMPPVYVLGEDDSPESLRCGVSNSSAVSAVESALRYNRVSIESKEAWYEDRALRMYVSVNALRDEYTDGSFGRSCAIDLDLQLNTYTNVFDPVSKKIFYSTIEFCKKGSLLKWDLSESQQKVNFVLKSYVDECISAYLKLLKEAKDL